MSRLDEPTDMRPVVYCGICGRHWQRPPLKLGTRLVCYRCGTDVRHCANPRSCVQAKMHGVQPSAGLRRLDKE